MSRSDIRVKIDEAKRMGTFAVKFPFHNPPPTVCEMCEECRHAESRPLGAPCCDCGNHRSYFTPREVTG